MIYTVICTFMNNSQMSAYEQGALTISFVALIFTLPGICVAIIEIVRAVKNKISIKVILTNVRAIKREQVAFAFNLQIINRNAQEFSIYDLRINDRKNKHITIKISGLVIDYGRKIHANECMAFDNIVTFSDEEFDIKNCKFVFRTNRKDIKSKILKKYIEDYPQ